jgi:hypothetical protein
MPFTPEKKKAYMKVYGKELYNYRKAHGICVRCGKEDATQGLRCAECVRKAKRGGA